MTATPSPAIPTTGTATEGRSLRCATSGRTSTPSANATMPSSHTEESASDQPTASGVQASGPIGTPHTRDTAQTPRIPAFRSAPAASSPRVGLTTTPTAHDNWSHATTAKKVPWAHDSS